MMEESDKREERLRAMRSGAGQESPSSSTGTWQLLNPMAQPSATPPVADRSPPPSRFDYYTDPMSAYSGNRSRSGHTHHPPYSFSSPVRGSSPMGQGRYCTTPPPVTTNHFQAGCSPHQGSYATPSPVLQSGIWRSPVGMAGPLSPHSSVGQGRYSTTPPPVPANHLQAGSSHQGSYATPSPVPQSGIWRSPVGMAGPFSPHGSVGTSGSPLATGQPFSSSRGISARPSFGRGVSPSAERERGSLTASNPRRGSPIVNSGRGGSWRTGNSQSPCSGRGSSQRGRISKELLSAREFPGMFFHMLMVLDPWARLEPVVGCILEPKIKQMSPDSRESWLPESIRTKRVKVEETASVSHSQGSLAEYLAQAMEEAVNEEAA